MNYMYEQWSFESSESESETALLCACCLRWRRAGATPMSRSAQEEAQSAQGTRIRMLRQEYIPYGERPEWDDVMPVLQDEGPNPPVPISMRAPSSARPPCFCLLLLLSD